MRLPVLRSGRPSDSTVVAVAFGVVLVGSLLPLPASGDVSVAGPLGVGADKWVHALSYTVLAALLAGRRDRYAAYGVVVLVAVFVAVAAFGVGVELLQSVVPGRTTSGADAVANAVGAAVGVVVGWLAGTRWWRDSALSPR